MTSCAISQFIIRLANGRNFAHLLTRCVLKIKHDIHIGPLPVFNCSRVPPQLAEFFRRNLRRKFAKLLKNETRI